LTGYTIDQVEEMLNKIAEEIPEDFYRELNGGILLLPEIKLHPKGKGDLYIMGEYCNTVNLGRYINIYYGSFMRVYGNVPEDLLYEKLKETLLHEFTHHLESLAGARDLEIKDEIKLNEYHRRIKGH
jgi:hypothetical protein